MTISVELQSIRGFAVMPSDLSIGEAASIEAQIVDRDGALISVSLKRFTIEAVLKGIGSFQSERLVREAARNRLALIRGSFNSGGDDLSVGGFSLINPVLTAAMPSGSITIEEVELLESVTLTFEDTVYQ